MEKNTYSFQMQSVHFSEDFLDPVSGSAASKATYIHNKYFPRHIYKVLINIKPPNPEIQ